MIRSRTLMGYLTVVLIFGIAAGIAGGSEEEMCVPMGEITIESPIMEPKRSSVDFPHAAHFDYSCKECHHEWDISEPISGCMAAGCHDLQISPLTASRRAAELAKDNPQEAGLYEAIASEPEIRYYKKAYHDKCIGCHEEIKNKNMALEKSNANLTDTLPTTGPTGCIECHPK